MLHKMDINIECVQLNVNKKKNVYVLTTMESVLLPRKDTAGIWIIRDKLNHVPSKSVTIVQMIILSVIKVVRMEPFITRKIIFVRHVTKI